MCRRDTVSLKSVILMFYDIKCDNLVARTQWQHVVEVQHRCWLSGLVHSRFQVIQTFNHEAGVVPVEDFPWMSGAGPGNQSTQCKTMHHVGAAPYSSSIMFPCFYAGSI